MRKQSTKSKASRSDPEKWSRFDRNLTGQNLHIPFVFRDFRGSCALHFDRFPIYTGLFRFPAAIPRDDGDKTARRMNTGWPWASEQPPAIEERNRYDSKSIGNE
jgi:hypothetical protein